MPIRSTAALPTLLLSVVWAMLLLAGLDVTLRRAPLPVYAAPAPAITTPLTDTVTGGVTVTWSSDHAAIDENGGDLLLTAILSPASPGGVVLSFATDSLSAAAPDDYAAFRRRVVVPAGQTVITVPVTLVDDALVESNEEFLVTVSSSQPTVTLGISETLVAVMDNDYAYLGVADAAGNEADGALNFIVTQSVTSTLETLVAYHTVDDTATATDDYRAAAGMLTFSPGSTAVTISVVLTDDLVAESDEIFTMVLEAPTNAQLDRAVAEGRIDDDDGGLPTLTMHDAAADESAAYLQFAVELSAQSSQTVTLDYATEPGTAAALRNYQPVSGTLVMPPGEITATLVVVLFDDSIGDADKTVMIALSNPTYCTLAGSTAIGVIRNDDAILPRYNEHLFIPGLAR